MPPSPVARSSSSQRALRNGARKCSVEGCESSLGAASARGMCYKHYREAVVKEKAAQPPKKKASRTCKAVFESGQKCSRPVVSAASGLCKAHEAEAEVQKLFDPHHIEDFVLPERQSYEYKGREHELIAAQERTS